MMTVMHLDGTEYKIERRGNGRWFDTYFVYVNNHYFRVLATNPAEAVSKARKEYTRRILAH
jgi:hypothetical protein